MNRKLLCAALVAALAGCSSSSSSSSTSGSSASSSSSTTTTSTASSSGSTAGSTSTTTTTASSSSSGSGGSTGSDSSSSSSSASSSTGGGSTGSDSSSSSSSSSTTTTTASSSGSGSTTTTTTASSSGSGSTTTTTTTSSSSSSGGSTTGSCAAITDTGDPSDTEYEGSSTPGAYTGGDDIQNGTYHLVETDVYEGPNGQTGSEVGESQTIVINGGAVSSTETYPDGGGHSSFNTLVRCESVLVASAACGDPDAGLNVLEFSPNFELEIFDGHQEQDFESVSTTSGVVPTDSATCAQICTGLVDGSGPHLNGTSTQPYTASGGNVPDDGTYTATGAEGYSDSDGGATNSRTRATVRFTTVAGVTGMELVLGGGDGLPGRVTGTAVFTGTNHEILTFTPTCGFDIGGALPSSVVLGYTQIESDEIQLQFPGALMGNAYDTVITLYNYDAP